MKSSKVNTYIASVILKLSEEDLLEEYKDEKEFACVSLTDEDIEEDGQGTYVFVYMIGAFTKEEADTILDNLLNEKNKKPIKIHFFDIRTWELPREYRINKQEYSGKFIYKLEPAFQLNNADNETDLIDTVDAFLRTRGKFIRMLVNMTKFLFPLKQPTAK